MGVHGLPADEYDCLVDRLVSWLHAGKGPELRGLLAGEPAEHFAISPPADLDAFLATLMAWWSDQRATPG